MRLSAPIHRLKRHAKALAREDGIPLNRALNRIARQEGFSNWSLLAAQAAKTDPDRALLKQLTPGDLVLLAARPGHGKTMMSLQLIMDTLNQGRTGAFFTLEYTATDVFDRFHSIGADHSLFEERFLFDDCDSISGAYICDRLAQAPRGTVAVVDYLQILDQKRDNPELSVQVGTLKSFAKANELIIVMISQINRSFERSARPHPGLDDVRLPNPLDLNLFNKACFINNGTMQLVPVRHG